MGVDLRITLLPAIVTKIEAKFGIFSGDHFEIWAAILEFQVLGCSGWLHWIPLPNKHGYRPVPVTVTYPFPKETTKLQG